MSKAFNKSFRKYLHNWNFWFFFEFCIFLFIFYPFEIFWGSYENDIRNIPFLGRLSNSIGTILLDLIPRILNPVLRLDLVHDKNSIILSNGFHVKYGFNLSGLKQMFLVFIVFLIISGSWIKKLWYIPLNIIFILFLVVIRFLVLTAHCTIYPEHYQILQTILFGPMFYFEIIIMWIIWVLFVAKTGSQEFAMPNIFRKAKEN